MALYYAVGQCKVGRKAFKVGRKEFKFGRKACKVDHGKGII